MSAAAAPARGTVLVVDDERAIRLTLRMLLEAEGLEVRDLETAEAALALLREGADAVDLLVSDIQLGAGMSGIELLRAVRGEPALAALPVVIISGHATVADAIGAIKLGATDFFEKPLERERVLVCVRNALNTGALLRRVARLEAQVGVREEMLGESAAMRRLFAEIEKVAPLPRARVLVVGESGTGKELIARAIHRLSPRREGPFVKVNCAAIPPELIESELFGHEKGAFTGAVARRRGFFEAADGGTLFLDEIGDMPLAAQSKLLRALQEGEITRVGSDQVIRVDARVIAATNRDLEADIAAGRFREDLYFRLNVVPLRSPPLRERAEDVAALAQAFARRFCEENGIRPKPIEPAVLAELARRAWPGNVRELKNTVERMVILSGERITLADVPEEARLARELRARLGAAAPPPAPPGGHEAGDPDDADDDAAGACEPGESASHAPGGRATLREYRDAAEKRYIAETLREVDWNISRAATLLGLERTNLHKKMRGLGIKREE